MFTKGMADAYGVDLEELKSAIDTGNAEFALADQTQEIERIAGAIKDAQGTS